MNARHMFKALALPILLACFASSVGCTHRTIIEEEEVGTDDYTSEPAAAATSDRESAVANHALYVRSGESEPGETQSGPFPQPWQNRLGPFPQPWQRDGEGADDGKSPPPPSDPNPNPDPNPKP